MVFRMCAFVFAGKPMWFTINDPRYHPVFLDDNIHYKEDDSIVNVSH